MIRSSARRTATIAVASLGVTFGGVAWYYRTLKTTHRPSTFDIHVKVPGPDGRPMSSTKSLPYLSMNEVETRLRQHAESNTIRRPRGDGRAITWKYETAQFAANDPIEDAKSSAFVQRDPSPHAPPGDLLFFAVMDGHAGYDTSRLLSKTLIPTIALELSSLIATPPPDPKSPSALDYLKSFVSASSGSPSTPYSFDADPTYVGAAIKTAFAKLDSDIVNAPIRLMQTLTAKPFDIKPHEHPMALPTMLPALSGACALVALLDTARRDMYIACTGDSRAVAGYWDESANGEGKWRVEVLSEDQTGRNPNELKRMQSEHPTDEAPYVIQRGRVLGGLEPSRAFGDARYKWPNEMQDKLYSTLLSPDLKYRGAPRGLKTPPYVTAEPVVTHRKLSFLPTPAESNTSTVSSPKSTLRFVVIATDGLWDALSSEEVVSLVGGYLQNKRGSIPKSTLAKSVTTTETALTVEGKDKDRAEDVRGSWAFEDKNVGTHLIRNAFGGADEERLRKLVSIPAPAARRFRDDVTVTVVWWEDGGVLNTKPEIAAKL